jgi:hypothetical protein
MKGLCKINAINQIELLPRLKTQNPFSDSEWALYYFSELQQEPVQPVSSGL